jgi:fatty acid desaturase
MSNQLNHFFLLLISWLMVGLVVFEFSNKYSLKRKLYPAWNILLGGFVIAWLAKLVHGWQVYVVAYPPIAVVIIWSIWATRFCQKCGKTNFSNTSFKPTVNCRRCGRPLK